VEVRNRHATDLTARTHGFHRGIERPHGHRHVAGVRRDAGIARADNRVLAIDPPDGRAAAARLPFVAGLVGVVEVRTAGPLQQVARGRRLVAQLAGGAGHQRPRQQSIVPSHPIVGGEIGVAHQCADTQSTFRRRLDLVE
jgi:hypothetical protein